MNSLNGRLDRAAYLADRLEEGRDRIQEAAALDAGFPVKVTGLEVDIGVQYLRTMQEEIPWIEHGKPYGTVAGILPYDAPCVVVARLGGSALITGNRLRFSFSSLTPRSAAAIADVCKAIDTFEPIVGMDNREYGGRCVEDSSVRVLFMSGASAVGEAYRNRFEAFDKLFFAGPGGMPAAVVFEDGDAAAAARFIGTRAFLNGGQYCTTLKKALIHRKHYDAIREAVVNYAGSLKVGDPFDPGTDIGPIRVKRTRLIVESALRKCAGARVIAGGLDGDLIHPLVLEAEPDLLIPDLELFGPFLLLKPFDDPDVAVRELMETRYGFLMAFFGMCPEGALEVFRHHFGMVLDNPDFLFTPLRAPFGGKKESGWIIERSGDGWLTRDGAFIYSKELSRTG